MSASVRSKRAVVSEVPKGILGGGAIATVFLVLGAVLMVVAIHTGSVFAAIPGFVSFAGSLLYWNARLWNAIFGWRK